MVKTKLPLFDGNISAAETIRTKKNEDKLLVAFSIFSLVYIMCISTSKFERQ